MSPWRHVLFRQTVISQRFEQLTRLTGTFEAIQLQCLARRTLKPLEDSEATLGSEQWLAKCLLQIETRVQESLTITSQICDIIS